MADGIANSGAEWQQQESQQESQQEPQQVQQPQYGLSDGAQRRS